MLFSELLDFNVEFYSLILYQQFNICTEKLGFNFYQTNKIFPQFFDFESKTEFSRFLLPYKTRPKRKKNRQKEIFQIPSYFAHLYVLFLQETIFFQQLFYFQTKFSFFELNLSNRFFCFKKFKNLFKRNDFHFIFTFPPIFYESSILLESKTCSETNEQKEILKSWSFHSFLFSFFLQKNQLNSFSFSSLCEPVKFYLKKMGYWQKISKKNSSTDLRISSFKIKSLLGCFKEDLRPEILMDKSFLWKPFMETSENSLQKFFLFFKLKFIISKFVLILFLNPKFESKNSQLNFQSNFQYSVQHCVFSVYQQFSRSQRNLASNDILTGKEITPKFIWKFHCFPFSDRTTNQQKDFKTFFSAKNSLKFSKFFLFFLFCHPSITHSEWEQPTISFQKTKIPNFSNFKKVKLEFLFSICKNRRKTDDFSSSLSVSDEKQKETIYFQTFQSMDEKFLKSIAQIFFHFFEKDTFLGFLDQNLAILQNYEFHPLKTFFFNCFKKKVFGIHFYRSFSSPLFIFSNFHLQKSSEKACFFLSLEKSKERRDYKSIFSTFLKNQIFQYDFDFLFFTENQFLFQKFCTFFNQWFFKKFQSLHLDETSEFEDGDFRKTKTLQTGKISHSFLSFMGEKPGVEFLGFSLIHYSLTLLTPQNNPFDFDDSSKTPQVLKSMLFPSKFQTLQYLADLKQILKKNKAQSQEVLIQKLRPFILNWCFHYRIVSNQKIMSFCDFMLFKWLWKWCCRRHSKKSQNWIRNKYFVVFKNSFSFSLFFNRETERNLQNRNLSIFVLEKQNQNCFFCCSSEKTSFSTPSPKFPTQSPKEELGRKKIHLKNTGTFSKTSIRLTRKTEISYSCLPFHCFARKGFSPKHGFNPNLYLSQYDSYDENWFVWLIQ